MQKAVGGGGVGAGAGGGGDDLKIKFGKENFTNTSPY